MNKRGLVNHSFEGDNKNRLPSFLRFSVGCARAVQWAAEEAVAMGLRRQKILEKTKRTKIYLDVFHYGRPSLTSPPTSGDGMLFIQAGTQSQAEVVGWRLQ